MIIRAVEAAAVVDESVVAGGFDGEVMRRLPLAEAVLSLWAFVMDPEFLAGVFERHRGRSFEGVLTFPVFVELIADALLQHRGSGRQAFERAKQNDVLETSVEAMYGKLRRVPLSLSEGFLEEGTARLRELRSGSPVVVWPASLSELTPVIVDGKKLKQVAKRLLVARGQPGKLYGGKLLVAYVPTEALVRAFHADPDGEANDCKLMPGLIPRARQAIAGLRLWILDRQFCDLTQPRLLAHDGDHYIIRYHPKNQFERDTTREIVTSQDAEGRTLIDEWGWLGSAKSKHRLYVRRARLVRPGEEEIIVITDLLDETKYPAVDLLEAYLQRWGIEQVFQQITEVFHLQNLIGSTPEATLFQGAFCLMLYNLLQITRQQIAAAQPIPCAAESLSTEEIFRDVTRQLTAITELISPTELAHLIPLSRSAVDLQQCLTKLLSHPIPKLWHKTKNKAHRKKTAPKKQSGAHTSIAKLQSAAAQANASTATKTTAAKPSQ
jgi:Transposase DDE domain